MEPEASRLDRVDELKRSRPRDWFLRVSLTAVSLLIIWSWFASRPLLGRPLLVDNTLERRWLNFTSFLGQLVPAPVRESGEWADALPWAWELLVDKGWEALLNTIGVATSAIILSAAFVLPFLCLASRRLSRGNPLDLPGGRSSKWESLLWKIIGPVVRFCFVISRAVPEYLLAFLLLSLLGRQVWPLVLALAIHNFGILGRLWGEVVENADIKAAEQRIAAGNSRSNTFATTIFPGVFNRFLIYFFYRWETCVKDATVLGMLGLLTLGKLIELTKGFFWDQAFFFILLGASVILIGDFLSTLIRTKLR